MIQFIAQNGARWLLQITFTGLHPQCFYHDQNVYKAVRAWRLWKTCWNEQMIYSTRADWIASISSSTCNGNVIPLVSSIYCLDQAKLISEVVINSSAYSLLAHSAQRFCWSSYSMLLGCMWLDDPREVILFLPHLASSNRSPWNYASYFVGASPRQLRRSLGAGKGE